MILENGEMLLRWPLTQHVVTHGYFYTGGGLHRAVDLRAPVGTPVYAAGDGRISVTYRWNGERTHGDTNSYGNFVKLHHSERWRGGAVDTLYAHLSRIDVEQGQRVQAGQLIGFSGDTGYTFGAHLHYEVRYNGVRTNPLVWHDNKFSTAGPDVFTFAAGEHPVEVPDAGLLVPLQCGISRELYERLDTIARREGMGVSQIITKALTEWAERTEK